MPPEKAENTLGLAGDLPARFGQPEDVDVLVSIAEMSAKLRAAQQDPAVVTMLIFRSFHARLNPRYEENP